MVIVDDVLLSTNIFLTGYSCACQMSLVEREFWVRGFYLQLELNVFVLFPVYFDHGFCAT